VTIHDGPQIYSGSATQAGGATGHVAPSPLIPPLPQPATLPVAPGEGGQHYRLRLQAKRDDVFEVMKALQNLGDLIDSMQIAIVATARSGQPFIPNKIHNLVVEPMTEESPRPFTAHGFYDSRLI
jgi:hypothetical protein